MGDLLASLAGAVDASGILTGDDIGPRYTDTRGHGPAGAPACVMRPTSTAEVSAILKLCHDAGRTVVPQGGMTGLVGGGTPGDGDVVLSLERMNAIEEIDPIGRTMIADAGVVLETAHGVADDAGFVLPIDLGARGSATLGGLISTNAGGNRVIRYGMTRQSVLGLEAVLADGTILTSMNRMLKNNAGYDLKQLFIGSEGTLGLVTRCVLRLQPKPLTTSTAFVGIDDFQSVPAFLALLDTKLGGGLGAFEVMWSEYYDFVRDHCPSLKPPLPPNHKYYVVTDALGSNPEADKDRFEAILETAHTQGLIQDGVVAQSDKERDDLWAIREGAGEGFRTIAPMFTYDVSMPITVMDDFATQSMADIEVAFPGAKTLILGHLGDGNLHAVVSVGDGSEAAHRKVNDILYGIIRDAGGSVSAEHGIGTEKRDYLNWSRTDAEVEIMRMLKRTLDPKGILNPGKVI
ncbi:MAG: FAD-binding oxidoreductase [Rhodospirillaceae bacterium]|jgi:FAD/FMN-containing dehydrogenase|nr:FAD-binding oxidoreductase [Rhodospirillaceae bacterium]MBT6089620.1 FAD-binding oxidoreductase [Rhodospirillaceae bacterium]